MIITVSNTQGVLNGNTFCVFGIDTEQKRSIFYKIQSFRQHKLNKKKSCKINILQDLLYKWSRRKADKASLVSLFFNYMSVLLRKTWTMQVQALSEFHSKNRCYTNTFKKLIITRNRVVAKQSRREGVYNRTGDLSVTCFGKEERRRE